MKGRIARHLAASACAGVIALLGRPGIDFWPCAVLGLFAFMVIAIQADRAGAAALHGLMFGLVFMPVGAVSALGWGLAPVAAMIAAGTLLYILPLSLLCFFGSRWLRPAELFLATVAGWTLWLSFADFLGFPMKITLQALIGHLPWLFWGGRLVGGNVVSAIFTASCLVAAVSFVSTQWRQRWRALVPFSAGLAVLGLLSTLARLTAAEASGELSVGVPQLNVESSYYAHRHGLPEATRALEARLSQQLTDLSNTELLALPETFDGRYGLLFPARRRAWQSRAEGLKQASLVTSYLVSSDGRRTNAVAGISSSGQLVGVHNKVNLAPFGESQLRAGEGFTPLELGGKLRVGALICQEVLLTQGPYSLARKGANLLVATTSDISFLSTVLVFEHFAAAQNRAIESGRSIVWAGNGGRSGVISRWGTTGPMSRFRYPEAVRLRASLHDEITPYVQTAWLWPLLAALTLLGLAFRAGPLEARIPPLWPGGPGWAPPAILAFALLTAGILVVCSPALVEKSRGDPARAAASIPELWRGMGPAFSREPPLARFSTDRARSLDGALAYYLSLYDPQLGADTLPGQRGDPSLAGARDYLQQAFALRTRELELDLASLPLVPTLVKLRRGSFGVFTYPGSGEVTLFDPVATARTQIALQQLPRVIEMRGVIPVADAGHD